jgi:ribosomal protein S18 acetylase RimI-like enzyme
MCEQTPSPLIRTAEADDYQSVLRLMAIGDQFHQAGRPDIFAAYQGPARTEDDFKVLVADENTALLVAKRQPEIVGYIHACFKQSDQTKMPIFAQRSYVTIESIVVDQAFQSSGIGQMLMDEAQSWAQGKGADSIELNVFEFNHKALRFYQNLGYETMSRKLELRLPKP